MTTNNKKCEEDGERFDLLNSRAVEKQSICGEQAALRKSRLWKWEEEIKTLDTRELHGLTVDDEVRQLLSDLSTFLFVLWKVELFAQFHVKHLQTDRVWIHETVIREIQFLSL